MSGLDRTWILLLAAGAGSRFGSPKALAAWQNETLISRAITVSTEVTGMRVFAVLGAQAGLLKAQVQSIHAILNETWQDGMGNSIAVGVRAIVKKDEQAEAVIILPVDQPLVSSLHITQLAEKSFRTGLVTLTANSRIKGPPACLPCRFFPKAMALKGDHGFKSFLTETDCMTIYNPRALLDADTPEALVQLADLAREETGLVIK